LGDKFVTQLGPGRQVCRPASSYSVRAGRQVCRPSHAKLGLKDWAKAEKVEKVVCLSCTSTIQV
jgi:hypothetical protein